MAGTLKGSSQVPTFEGLAVSIDAVTKLYSAVAAKSPVVADTVVLLVVLLPFYAVFMWWLGVGTREKQATRRIELARKASKKGSKKLPGGKKS